MGEHRKAERVGVCGSMLVMECPACGQRHPIRVRCGHKACGRCAEHQRWRKVEDLWPLAKTMRTPRFLTLTFKSKHRLTREWRKWQSDALRKFFRNPWVKENIGGGVWAWEVTYNQRLKMWHPHFHILFDGAYMPKAKVKEIWRGIADGAFIIDIRPIKGEGDDGKMGALRETVKYITKAIAFSDDEDLLTEFLTATKGMRRIGVFGDRYKGYKPPERPATDKRFWHFDPFTLGGANKIGCACGYEALPRFWNRLDGFHTDARAAAMTRTRGAPDPVVVAEMVYAKREMDEKNRELTFEETFK